jgi:hypothetical protein
MVGEWTLGCEEAVEDGSVHCEGSEVEAVFGNCLAGIGP